jgi:hypothetical protein
MRAPFFHASSELSIASLIPGNSRTSRSPDTRTRILDRDDSALLLRSFLETGSLNCSVVGKGPRATDQASRQSDGETRQRPSPTVSKAKACIVGTESGVLVDHVHWYREVA